MKRVGLLLAWLVVAAGLSGVAYQIVAAAESQVSDQPLTPIVAITSSTVDATTTTRAGSTTTSTGPGSTTTTQAGEASTTSSTTPTTVGSTSTSTPTSTTTTVSAAWTSRTIPGKGGEVVIQYRPGEVRLVAARPAPGYRVEVEAAGPPEVEVEFENETSEAKWEVKARWRNGALEVVVEG